MPQFGTGTKEGSVQLGILVPAQVREAIMMRVQDEGETASSVVRRALKAYLAPEIEAIKARPEKPAARKRRGA